MQKAITVFGSIRIALRSSESKYRTNPALDIRPPEFPLEAIVGFRHRDGLSVSASTGSGGDDGDGVETLITASAQRLTGQ